MGLVVFKVRLAFPEKFYVLFGAPCVPLFPARLLVERHGCEVVFLDYLQLMNKTDSEKRQEDHYFMGEVSKGMKGLAMSLGIPVIALAQLNRKAEDRPDHRPRMSDLRQSGQIEQDADMIGLLYRDCYYQPNNPDINKEDALLILAKNRNGPTGDISLRFVQEFTLFEDVFSE